MKKNCVKLLSVILLLMLCANMVVPVTALPKNVCDENDSTVNVRLY